MRAFSLPEIPALACERICGLLSTFTVLAGVRVLEMDRRRPGRILRLGGALSDYQIVTG